MEMVGLFSFPSFDLRRKGKVLQRFCEKFNLFSENSGKAPMPSVVRLLRRLLFGSSRTPTKQTSGNSVVRAVVRCLSVGVPSEAPR
jgi:hypothetical protein